MNDQIEIKINSILKKQSELEKKIMIIIQILNPDHDLFKKSDQSNDQNDHDPRAREDPDLVLSWYMDFLRENGIDPDGRNFDDKVLRSIAYFKAHFDTIRNPLKYGLSFLPPIVKAKPTLTEDSTKCFGFERDFLVRMSSLVSSSLMMKLAYNNQELKDLLQKYRKGIMRDIILLRFTAEAINQNAIEIPPEAE